MDAACPHCGADLFRPVAALGDPRFPRPDPEAPGAWSAWALPSLLSLSALSASWRLAERTGLPVILVAAAVPLIFLGLHGRDLGTWRTARRLDRDRLAAYDRLRLCRVCDWVWDPDTGRHTPAPDAATLWTQPLPLLHRERMRGA